MRARPAESAPRAASAEGVRVVMDARPLQEREHAPITASYLERLLSAYAASPVTNESFVLLIRAFRGDPTVALEERGLPVAGRRRLPPTSRVFRSAGLTLDSFLLRGAEVGTRAGGDDPTVAGTVYHTAGGAMPIKSGLPIVATVLDLAPWELPERYAATAAARFGHRLRARTLRDAVRLIVASRETALAVQRLLRIPATRIAVVPLAPDPIFRPDVADPERIARLRARFDLPPRYLVFAGRYDARKDFGTLFDALAALRGQARAGSASGAAWPPIVVLAGAAGDEHRDSAAVARVARRAGVDDLVRLTPRLEMEDLAALQAGAVAHVQPALSDGTGLAAMEALAVGIPVVCSRVGALPEVVGPAGIIVEARDPGRLATALRAVWEEGAVARQVTARARARAVGPQRSWADVAADTRTVYAAAIAG